MSFKLILVLKRAFWNLNWTFAEQFLTKKSDIRKHLMIFIKKKTFIFLMKGDSYLCQYFESVVRSFSDTNRFKMYMF